MKVKAIDVADYILEKCPSLSAMKLQKLVYYSQAWHLVWKDEALFEEDIQAWVGGPVVVQLYDLHKGVFKLKPGFFKGNTSLINKDSRDVVDRVLKFYGNRDAQWLSDLTHMEDPWIFAREGLVDGERGNKVIAIASMQEYYSSISI